MKRTFRLWGAVSVTLVLVMSLATQVVAESDNSSAGATGKQRIVQIATAELPPKEEKTTLRYILASMPGDTVAVLFIDQHLYAMRKDGTLEQVEGSIGGWAIASGGGTAFAVMHNVGRPKGLSPREFFLPIQAKVFDSSLKLVASMRINRHQRWIVSSDGELIVGVGPYTQHTPGSNASCFYREGVAPIPVARGAGGFANAAALSISGNLFVLGGSRGVLAYDGNGERLWVGEGKIALDDLVTSVSILQEKGRVAITRCVRCALPVNGDKAELLRLFDLKGSVVTEAKTSDMGLLQSGLLGEILVRRFGSSLRRVDPSDGSQLWRVEQQAVGHIDDMIVSNVIMFALDGAGPVVKAINLDGEILDTWACPGKGKPWAFVGSASCPGRFVTARSHDVFVCELQEEQP